MSTHRQLWMAALAVTLVVGLVGCSSGSKPSGAAGGTDKKGGTSTEPVAYTLKLKSHPDVGQSMTVIQKENSDGTFGIKDAAGKVLKEDKNQEVKETTYTVTTLEKGDKRPAKFKRVYETATVKQGNQSKTKSYSGKTVVFELKDGKYDIAIEGGGALDAKDLKDLGEEVNKPEMEEAFLPKKPVKVGESWDMDAKLVGEAMGSMELDLEKTKATAKLAKVYSKDGKQFGVIDLNLKLAVKGMNELKFDPPAVFDFTGALDTAIDGSTTAGTLAMKAAASGKSQIDAKGQKLVIELNMKMDMNAEHSAAKAAK